jgi:hypothetical protein
MHHGQQVEDKDGHIDPLAQHDTMFAALCRSSSSPSFLTVALPFMILTRHDIGNDPCRENQQDEIKPPQEGQECMLVLWPGSIRKQVSIWTISMQYLSKFSVVVMVMVMVMVMVRMRMILTMMFFRRVLRGLLQFERFTLTTRGQVFVVCTTESCPPRRRRVLGLAVTAAVFVLFWDIV